MRIRSMGNNYKLGSVSSEFGCVTSFLYLEIQFLKESRLHQVKRELRDLGSPKGMHLSIKQNKTNKSRKREEQHPHFLGSKNPTRKILASHLLEILKVLS